MADSVMTALATQVARWLRSTRSEPSINLGAGRTAVAVAISAFLYHTWCVCGLSARQHATSTPRPAWRMCVQSRERSALLNDLLDQMLGFWMWF